LVSGDAGKSAACSRNFVGQGGGFLAGAGLANEDVLREATGNRHGDAADGEGCAVIAITPLALKNLVTRLNKNVRHMGCRQS
jgi:hypothetical protein